MRSPRPKAFTITLNLHQPNDLTAFDVQISSKLFDAGDTDCLRLPSAACPCCKKSVYFEINLSAPPTKDTAFILPKQEDSNNSFTWDDGPTFPSAEPDVDSDPEKSFAPEDLVKVKVEEISAVDEDQNQDEKPLKRKRLVKRDPTAKRRQNRKYLKEEVLCSECGLTMTRAHLFKHLMNHKEQKLGGFVCNECHKTFPTKDRVRSHLKNVHYPWLGRYYQCDKCSKTCQTPAALKQHFDHVHAERTRTFVCDLCKCAYYDRSTLNQHRKVHEQKMEYQCNECGRLFVRKSSLHNHRLTHNPELKYSCQYCGKMFARKRGKEVHEKIHTGERNYHCTYPGCSSKFYDVGTRRQHILGHIRKEKGLGMMPLPEVARLYYKRGRYEWEPPAAGDAGAHEPKEEPTEGIPSEIREVHHEESA